uniref:Fatty acyl-CoA reductase n=1 Tax=Heligmosomoides polygyrus TaxID=6339 RepID=A0A8L8KMA2_HELPZ
LFNRIRERKPEVLAKLIPIPGDLMENGLGLNQHDMQKICDQVSIVIHSAATVKFDEQLRDAVEMNVVGTTRLVALCHKMKKLIVYDPPVAPLKLMEAIEWMDNDMISLVTEIYIIALEDYNILEDSMCGPKMDSEALRCILTAVMEQTEERQQKTLQAIMQQMERICDPDNGCTFDIWYNRYEDVISKDGESTLDDAAKARLIVSKLDAASVNSLHQPHSAEEDRRRIPRRHRQNPEGPLRTQYFSIRSSLYSIRSSLYLSGKERFPTHELLRCQFGKI